MNKIIKNLPMPNQTVLQCGAAAVASVLVLSWLRIRPLGVFFLALFGLWFYKTRCNLRIIPPPELEKKYQRIVEIMRDWRQNNPAMFCGVASACLGVLAVLGHLLTGSAVVLMGLVLAAIISSKYNFKIIRVEPKDFAWSEKLSPDNDLDDEFMPEVNDANLFVLERASDLATLSSPIDDPEADEEKSEEVPSELLLPDRIPEVDEHSSEDDDLVPMSDTKNMQARQLAAEVPPSTSSSSSSQAQTKDVIEFKKGHFKRDSSLSTTSSSSEESLSKGLQFPDHTTVDGPTANAAAAAGALRQLSSPPGQALLAQSSKLLPSLVSGIVQWSMGNAAGGGGVGGDGGESSTAAVLTAAPTSANQNAHRVVTALDSSDESDFEILENEDFK